MSYLHVYITVYTIEVKLNSTIDISEPERINDPLDFLCTISGINVNVTFKFICPNDKERDCPETSNSERRNFIDGYTTRISNSQCQLNIPRVALEHSGTFYCQVHPSDITTCHDLKSKVQHVTVQPQSPEHHDKNIEIGIPLAILSVILCVILVVLVGIRCRRKKIEPKFGDKIDHPDNEDECKHLLKLGKLLLQDPVTDL